MANHHSARSLSLLNLSSSIGMQQSRIKLKRLVAVMALLVVFTLVFNVETSYSSNAGTTDSSNTLLLSPLAVEESPLSIVVEISGDLGTDLSRLAFGKMLQVKVNKRHQIQTAELLVTKEPPILLLDCFPNIAAQVQILSEPGEFLKLQKLQQEAYASHSGLLEPTADNWPQALEFVSTRKIDTKTVSGHKMRTPFLYIRSYPALHQWDYLQEIFSGLFSLDKPKCCTLRPNDDEPVLWFPEHSSEELLKPSQLTHLFSSWKQATIIHGEMSYYEAMRRAGISVRPVHNHTPGAMSAVARYCLAQDAKHLVVISENASPLTIWAALTNTKASSIPWYSSSLSLNVTTAFSPTDPRSKLNFQPISSLPATNVERPTTLTLPETESPMYKANKDGGFSNSSMNGDRITEPANKTDLVSGMNETLPTLYPVTMSEHDFHSTPNATLNSKFYFGRPLGTLDNPLTIVIKVSGEMGNFLSKLSYGHSLHWMLQEDFNVSSNIQIQHQESSKWHKAALNLQRCFPAARPWSFEQANTDEFDRRLKQQQELLAHDYEYFHIKAGCQEEACIRNKTAFIAQKINSPGWKPMVEENYNISLPFVLSDEFASISYFNDRYAERIHELWHFDATNLDCCATLAYPDESVFHIRHFVGEMPRKGKRWGYEELSPNKIATELFGHLQKGEKIAFTSRFPRDFVLDHIQALEARGLQVRLLEGQNPTQDFCFLLSARKEYAGFTMSSYAIWAGYLGNATKARLYSVKSPNRITRLGEDGYFFRYNWTSPFLKNRVFFELYSSEEQDEIDAKKRNAR